MQAQQSNIHLNSKIFRFDRLSSTKNNFVMKKSFIHDLAVIQLAENRLASPRLYTSVCITLQSVESWDWRDIAGADRCCLPVAPGILIGCNRFCGL